jgi:hypothetical protein
MSKPSGIITNRPTPVVPSVNTRLEAVPVVKLSAPADVSVAPAPRVMFEALAPRVSVVAAPPMLSVVAVVLNNVAVVLEVVRSPPLSAMSPPTVALLVTARPVPAAVADSAPEKVLAPAAV